jgi:hypothetical protein
MNYRLMLLGSTATRAPENDEGADPDEDAIEGGLDEDDADEDEDESLTDPDDEQDDEPGEGDDPPPRQKPVARPAYSASPTRRRQQTSARSA